MKLDAFLAQHSLTQAAFAAKIGATPAAVSQWVCGDCKPRDHLMLKIMRVTDGAVRPEDFLRADAVPTAPKSKRVA